MNVQITDLGAVKSATIDLNKKLNVFCGPNGTGKTYISFIIYAITYLNNKSFGIRLDKELINQLVAENNVVIPLNLLEVWHFRNNELRKVKANLGGLFAVGESKQESYFGKTTIQIVETQDEFETRITALEYQWAIKLDNRFDFEIAKNKNERHVKVSISPDIIKNNELIEYLDITFLSRLYSLLTFFPISSATIFPVERSAIFTFSNELSTKNSIFIENNLTKFHTLITTSLGDKRYPQPIKDALKMAENLSEIEKRKSVYFDFATKIESELLKGKIGISKEGQVEFKSNKAKSISLSFHQSSSIVKTLASLVLYLKHLATKNDLIIIDEPELNLHPDNQILLTRIFAQLVNKGLRLLVSTHSDYIIRELNNLIMIAEGDEDVKETAQNFGYKTDEFLKANETQVYMFNYKNDSSLKTEVKPIVIEKSGFSVKSIDETIDHQNEISEQLYATLKYGKQE